jgi:hypothetical protein
MSEAIKVWAEGLMQGPALQKVNAAKSHALGFGQGVRASGEGVIVGGLLGMAAAVIPGGLDQHMGMLPKPVPLDGVFGSLALLGTAMAGADHPVSTDLSNAAAVSFGILGFRKMQDYIHQRQISVSSIKAKLGPKGAKVAGEGRMGSGRGRMSSLGIFAGESVDPVAQTIESWQP